MFDKDWIIKQVHFWTVKKHVKKQFGIQYLSYGCHGMTNAHHDEGFDNFIPFMKELAGLYMEFNYNKGGNPYIEFDLEEYYHKVFKSPLKEKGYDWMGTAYNQWTREHKINLGLIAGAD